MPALAVVRNRTCPGPLPCSPSTTAIHDTAAFAAHAQPVATRTLTFAVCSPPASSKDEGSSTKWQAAASCVISADCEPRTRVPRRLLATGFGAIV